MIAFAGRTLPALLFLLLSAVRADEAIRVDRGDDAVIVRSSSAQGNFLFRAPAVFHRVEEPEAGFVLVLESGGEPPARIRLRYGPVAAADAGKGAAALARAKRTEYLAGAGGECAVEGGGGRARARMAGHREVLLVRDGKLLYELFLDGENLGTVADGFTILEPRGAPVSRETSPADLKPKPLAHSFYRIDLLKPFGFVEQPVDAHQDKGIWVRFQREEKSGRCDIAVRVFLARTVKESVEAKAQSALDAFARTHNGAKVPRKPRRARWSGAKEAYLLKMSGRLPKSGLVVQSERRFIDHENGRLYDIEVKTYGGARQAFRKDLALFWKKLRLRGK